jgi:hypothetical protein
MSRKREFTVEHQSLRRAGSRLRITKGKMSLRIFYLCFLFSFFVLNQGVRATPLPENDSIELSKASSTASADVAMIQIASLVKRGLLNEAEVQLEKLYAENLDSPTIHLLRADLLTKLGRPAEARKALEIAYKFTPDNLEVLKRVAASRDAYADQAAEVYEELAKKLENEDAASSELLESLERGLVVALRDGDSAAALRLSQKLRAQGRPGILQSSAVQDSSSAATIGIPGGIRALARMAGMQEPKTPDTFLTQYAERLVRLHDMADISESLQTFRGLKEYFKIVIELQSLTRTRKEGSEIHLDSRDKPRQDSSERILFLLGWQIKKQGNRRVLEQDNREVLGYRKKVAEALGIQDDELKAALESGKPFNVIVPTDLVPIQISVNYWTNGLLNGSKAAGGLAEAFVDTLQSAYLYVAFSRLNKETQVQIIQSINPKTLLKEHWKTLYLYGGSLSVSSTQVETPGGTKAAEAWERLVGADDHKISPFLNALLSKDAGRLMAFYYVLSGLPSVNQQFFTRNSKQLETLYKAFALPGKNLPSADTFLRKNTVFFDVAREIPLSGGGEIQFPGGSGVWKSRKSEAKKTNSAPVSSPQREAEAKSTTPPPLMAGINKVGGTETSPFPSVGTLKKVDLTESSPSPVVGRSKKEEEIENNSFPAADTLNKVDPTEIDPLALVENSKKEQEIESNPSSSVDSLKKIDEQETASFPSIRRSKKVDGDERDPFPSIYKLRKVEIRESNSFLAVSSAKKSDRQEANPFPVVNQSRKVDAQEKSPFPSVDSMKKVDAKESAPLPVAGAMSEGEEQRESGTKILTEMFSTRDEDGRQTPTRLEAFLTIVRLEKHWGETLDESSVSLLLENFNEHKQLLPYLASLPPLGTNQLRDFFLAVRNLDSLKSSDLALIVGDFQCFLKLLSLLYENGAIRENSVSSLFENLCQRFATVKTDAEFARSSFLVLDGLKKNLQYSFATPDSEKPPVRASGDDNRPGLSPSIEATNHDIDELLFEAFAGPSNITRIKLDAEEIEIDLPGWKKGRMREVMALQAIPATDELLKIFQQLDNLANNDQDPTSVFQTVDNLISNLRDVDETLWESVPKGLQLSMIQPHREKILRSLSALKISVGRGASPSERASLASKVIQELHPSLHLSLLGWIYAYHFSPNDLLIKEDPLFIRRHRFLASASMKRSIWHETDIDSLDADSGSYLRGGVAQISAAAGEIGLVTDQAVEAIGRDQGGSRLAGAQLAALRAIPWRKWNSLQLRDYCLKIRLGKELLAQASLDSEVLTGIAEDLRVLVGPKRCRVLLQTLPGSTSTDSAGLLSSEELFELADGYWRRKGPAGWRKSPLADELARKEPNQTSESISWIGGYYPRSYGCGHAHRLPLAPYEEYENVKDPELISERLSHVLLDIAEKIDRLGFPLELLPLLAEPAVRQLALTKFMSDWGDWQSALEGLRELRLESLISHLQENP